MTPFEESLKRLAAQRQEKRARRAKQEAWLRTQQEGLRQANTPILTARQKLLSDLGFRNWGHYWKSAARQEIHQKKLALHPTCALCRKKADQVFYLWYSHQALTNHQAEDLVSLCSACLQLTTASLGNRPKPIAEAQHRCRKLLARVQRGKPLSRSRSKKPGYGRWAYNYLPGKNGKRRPAKRGPCLSCGRTPKHGMLYCGPCLEKEKLLRAEGKCPSQRSEVQHA